MWRTTFPLNYRTVLFCFFVGSLLSVPCGFMLNFVWELFTPPLWTAPIYVTAVLISLVALPFWSLEMLGDQRLLRQIGILISCISLAGILLALLFPTVH